VCTGDVDDRGPVLMYLRAIVVALVLSLAGTHVSADLVGYWPLDGNALDASGNGNNGIISGNVVPTADRHGNAGAAMMFAGGANDKIDLGDRLQFQITGAMTVCAWAYLDSTSSVHGTRNSRIIAKMGAGGSRSWSCGIEKSAGGIAFPATFQVASNGSTIVGVSDDASLPLDQWVHFASVYTPGVSLQVYLNGELAAIRTTGVPASQFSNNGVGALVGNRPAASDCGWYGALDEVRLYDEVLSQDQIKAVMDGERVNRKPDVDAGTGGVLVWPDNIWVLDATAVDDGMGDPDGFIGYVWSTADGSGDVTFEPSPFVEDPAVTFSAPGEYTLLLTVTDGELEGSDTVVIRVVEPFCPMGDLNGDCRVDMEDLLLMAVGWLGDDDTLDIDRSNKVDMGDLSLLAGDWRIERSRLPLVINEILARNAATEPPDPQGHYDDWIEIFNCGDEQIDVGGMYLTDDLLRPAMWQVPTDQPESTTIPGRSYLIIWADGHVNDSGLHASFSLDADKGEEVGLFDVDGRTLIDSVTFGPQVVDVSYGRQPDGGKSWCTLDPSPDASNNDRFLGVVGWVRFDPEHGFFDEPFEVAITTETMGATVYFTTDCSNPILPDGNPSMSAQAYDAATNKPRITTTTCLRAAAIAGPGWKPGPVMTQTYIFLDEVLRQTRPSGYPTSWHYDMDLNVVNHASYAGRIREDLKSLPTLAIVSGRDSIFGSSGVINAAATSIEVEASAEMIHPDGRKGFQINCGLIPHSHVKEKRGLRLYFRSGYGQPKLRYPIFDGAPEHAGSAADEFDRLILRAGGNDQLRANSAGRQVDRAPQGVKASYLTDQLARDSQIAMSGYGSHGTFVHLYLNGLYWGLYNIVERPDAFFTSTYFGGQKEDWFAVNHSGNISGDGARFNYLHSNRTNWNVVREYLDVSQFCDYIIYYLYSGAGDWPNNNWYAGNRNTPVPGKIQYYIWDAEDSWLHAWKNDGHSYHRSNEGAWIHPVLLGLGGLTNGTDLVSRLWREVDDQSDFMMEFADRVYRHCFNEGALTDARTIERWDRLCGAIDGGVVAESARWGRYRASPGMYAHGPLPNVWTREDWLWYTDYVRGLMNGNADRLIAALRDTTRAGPVLVNHPLYYPTINPPEFLVDGAPLRRGYIAQGSVLTIKNPNDAGTVYYTTNGADPRLPGGQINVPEAVACTGPVVLDRTVNIRARALKGAEWSALNEGVYAVPEVARKLRITEIMYHPADPPPGSGYTDGDFEFIELKHVGDPDDPSETPINLNMARFSKGIDYRFDASVVLNPGRHVVVVKNPDAFITRYDTSGMNIAPGRYSGSLDNGGEKIVLEDALGAVIHSFTYDDDWYQATDGGGLSLTIRNPNSTDPNDWNRQVGWRASSVLHGTPGRDDDGVGCGDVVINEVLSYSSGGADDWIELRNLTDRAIHLGGMYLGKSKASDVSLRRFRVPDGTTIGPNGGPGNSEYLVFSETELGFALSKNGDAVYLSQDVGGVLTVLAEEHFGAAQSDVAFGLYYKASTRTSDFVPVRENTPGAPNSGPMVGPIVICEIMYHPAGEAAAEYVELVNISGQTVNLWTHDASTMSDVPWRFTDFAGIQFEIPLFTGMTPGQRVILTRDATAFDREFTITDATIVIPWANGNLDNAGETIEIQMPGDYDPVENRRYYVRVDRVRYSDGSHPGEFAELGYDPWPVEADGAGKALHRINASGYGNDVVNWQAGNPTPGN